MTNLVKAIVSTGAVALSFAAYADMDNQLEKICTQSGVTTKQVVKVGQSQRVELLQGGMLVIDGEGVAPTKQLLAAELSALGVGHDCAEYFLANGSTNQADGRVYFGFDSHQLTPASKQILDSLLDKIRSSSSSIVLAGHTDSTGEQSYNFSLGLQRAESVKSHLVAKGVESKNLESVSFGESQPMASNETLDGRKANRRVELSLSNPK
ncbi:OmpA family protein [Vibrio fluminensis]|uniref:OmpA family protein n=1 Tax=Vibrio fluminensis TaxID=2783614 RepID=UPI001886F675|nr:OmpA family protein [Vibrio fluminensis]